MSSHIRKKQVYGAVVIRNDPDLRDAKAVAAREVQRRFKTKQYINIREMIYSSLLDIYVCIFQLPKRENEQS